MVNRKTVASHSSCGGGCINESTLFRKWRQATYKDSKELKVKTDVRTIQTESHQMAPLKLDKWNSLGKPF
jgi:hypothetical protein